MESLTVSILAGLPLIWLLKKIQNGKII